MGWKRNARLHGRAVGPLGAERNGVVGDGHQDVVIRLDQRRHRRRTGRQRSGHVARRRAGHGLAARVVERRAAAAAVDVDEVAGRGGTDAALVRMIVATEQDVDVAGGEQRRVVADHLVRVAVQRVRPGRLVTEGEHAARVVAARPRQIGL